MEQRNTAAVILFCGFWLPLCTKIDKRVPKEGILLPGLPIGNRKKGDRNLCYYVYIRCFYSPATVLSVPAGWGNGIVYNFPLPAETRTGCSWRYKLFGRGDLFLKSIVGWRP